MNTDNKKEYILKERGYKKITVKVKDKDSFYEEFIPKFREYFERKVFNNEVISKMGIIPLVDLIGVWVFSYLSDRFIQELKSYRLFSFEFEDDEGKKNNGIFEVKVRRFSFDTIVIDVGVWINGELKEYTSIETYSFIRNVEETEIYFD